MKFSTSLILLALGLMATATPMLNERDPEALAEPEALPQDADTDVSPVPDDVKTITQPGCKKGQYRCVGVVGVCTKCAIGVGIGANTCKLNNRCGATNSCQVANGQPYCV